MSNNVMHEITPLTPGDCFTIFSRVKKKFDFPLHYHSEFELNLIINAQGARRVIGSHTEVIDAMELVLIGPNLNHAWMTHECETESITEVTIQFHGDLFDEKFLKRHQLTFVKKMLDNSHRGVQFSHSTIMAIKNRIVSLSEKGGLDSVLELLSILHDLSISRNIKILSEPNFANPTANNNSTRMEKVFAYMNTNYNRPLTLAEVASVLDMPETSFSRFIKKQVNKTFVDSLNEIRLVHASRMLIDTTYTIAEIAYKCGFNNISNFNRLFKRKKLCVPKEFRETYIGSKIFI